MESLHFYIDEAGRGPLAGPLAVGFILPLKKIKKADIELFKDSKKLNENGRERLFQIIQKMEEKKQIFTKVTYITAKKIDNLGMTKAQALAIETGIKELCNTLGKGKKISLHLDGNKDFGLRKKYPEREVETIIKGDDKIKEISMASIIAKVSRDRWMQSLSPKYQKYEFKQHKGYGTKLHYEKIREFGPCDLHRKLFLKERFPNHKIKKKSD